MDSHLASRRRALRALVLSLAVAAGPGAAAAAPGAAVATTGDRWPPPPLHADYSYLEVLATHGTRQAAWGEIMAGRGRSPLVRRLATVLRAHGRRLVRQCEALGFELVAPHPARLSWRDPHHAARLRGELGGPDDLDAAYLRLVHVSLVTAQLMVTDGLESIGTAPVMAHAAAQEPTLRRHAALLRQVQEQRHAPLSAADEDSAWQALVAAADAASDGDAGDLTAR